uniref:Uncharacterized protein n=1 Tax=Acrobeloides nanus TaxID=290746 RepID=A0A914BWG5_9BILA
MNLYYYECLNVPYLVQNGADSVWDAYQTLSIYLQQHFVCGAGFGVYLANEACLTNVWQSQRRALDDYRGLYDTQVQTQLGSAESQVFCDFGDQLKVNYQSVFEGICTTDRIDASWWACEYARVNVITQFPFCSTAGYRCVSSARAPPS